ncbi:MAG: L-asparaginase I, cytoplasmic [Cytophagales bacterium]|jgi:L-asparaginase|nr:MAG: L-asparaginase I, cytoplasmic [Cytophagales bacterium]
MKRININTATPALPQSKVMIIYTGGTFGMAHDANGVLVPFDFNLILEHLPALRNLSLDLTVVSFDQPIDSSNILPSHWQQIAQLIFDNHDSQDGFVVLHGTDTMAFTASALSFMLQGLKKPVVFTGAQLPISEPRSDARENLITSLEIAAAKKNNQAIVPEVCIYFGDELLRGNRSKKVESMHFDAFQSENYPPLAKAGVKIDYNESAILKPKAGLRWLNKLDTSIAILKLFPGITHQTVSAVTGIPGLKAIVMETFGAGNAPTSSSFLNILKEAITKGIIILNISQCPGGMVVQGRYETSKELLQIGVISGSDMTTEAALTKLMVLLAEESHIDLAERITTSVCGEITN